MKDHQKDGYIGTHSDGTSAWIGPELALPNYNFFYLYVWWGISDRATSEEQCTARISVVCKSQKMTADLYHALQAVPNTAAKMFGGEVFLAKVLEPELFRALDSHFDALVTEWIRHVKSIGGLKKYLVTQDVK